MNNIEVLMFTSPTCTPCKTMYPLVEALPVKTTVVDVAALDGLEMGPGEKDERLNPARYGIRGGFPQFVQLVNGVNNKQKAGAMSSATLWKFATQE